MRRLLPLALVSLIVAGCGSDAPSLSKIPIAPHRFAIDGQPDLLLEAPHRTARVVVYIHGAGETVNAVLRDPLKRPLVVDLLAHGYAVASSQAHGENWGDRVSVQDYVRLISHLRREGYARVYVLAQSMGGLDAAQLAAREHFAAFAALFPVDNVRSVAATLPQFDGEIAQADTANTLSPVPLAGVRGLRMMFWASPHDTMVLRSQNSEVMAAQARSVGARVTFITTRGNHGDPSNFQPRRLLSFYAGH